MRHSPSKCTVKASSDIRDWQFNDATQNAALTKRTAYRHARLSASAPRPIDHPKNMMMLPAWPTRTTPRTTSEYRADLQLDHLGVPRWATGFINPETADYCRRESSILSTPTNLPVAK